MHYIKANLEGDLKEENIAKNKSRVREFFKLFDSFDNMGNNMDAIVDNLLLEYENQIEYKEIIGTKYVYIWGLTSTSISYSTCGNVEVHLSPDHTLFFVVFLGSIVSLPKITVISP